MRLLHRPAGRGDDGRPAAEGGGEAGERPAAGSDDEGGEGGARDLASRVDVADSLLARARGLMFRRSVPDDYALAFRFDGAGVRWLHMLFVPFDIDAVWAVDGRVTRVERLAAWTGLARAEADLVVELPAGAAADVARGDRIELRDA